MSPEAPPQRLGPTTEHMAPVTPRREREKTMSEQTKSDQPQATTGDATQVETAPLADTDLENISGGGVGGNAVVNGGGGYTAAKP